MKIYTKNGDRGMTTMLSPTPVSKSDDRIQALGAVDALTSQIGLAKVIVRDAELRGNLERIQRSLITLMAGVASDPFSKKYVFPESEVGFLETEIDRMESQFERVKEFILPGGCELSARLDAARTAARTAERAVVASDRKFPVQAVIKQYLNRLSDYLYIAARYADAANKSGRPAGGNAVMDADFGELNLATAKALTEIVEQYAREQGKRAVIAVVNSEGNPISVHVMDGAFLVSFQVALDKAYTAVSVKMSTMELSKLVAPGQTFYGLQNMPRMAVFGGGVPLKDGNGAIVGGLGISGGTGEEDHALCEFALAAFERLMHR